MARSPDDRSTAGDAKAKRLAEALRANLKRRKEQARQRAGQERDPRPAEQAPGKPEA